MLYIYVSCSSSLSRGDNINAFSVSGELIPKQQIPIGSDTVTGYIGTNGDSWMTLQVARSSSQNIGCCTCFYIQFSISPLVKVSTLSKSITVDSNNGLNFSIDVPNIEGYSFVGAVGFNSSAWEVCFASLQPNGNTISASVFNNASKKLSATIIINALYVAGQSILYPIPAEYYSLVAVAMTVLAVLLLSTCLTARLALVEHNGLLALFQKDTVQLKLQRALLISERSTKCLTISNPISYAFILMVALFQINLARNQWTGLGRLYFRSSFLYPVFCGLVLGRVAPSPQKDCLITPNSHSRHQVTTSTYT